VADELNQDSGSKTKLINDMVSLMQKLGSEFDKIDSKSKDISNNLKGLNGVLGSLTGGGSGVGSNGGAGQVSSSQGTFSGGFGGAASGVLSALPSALVGVASGLATMMPSVQQAVSSQLLTSQARFSGMSGNVNATVQSVMGMGTSNSSSDLQQAISQGTANGVLPGLPGYNSQILPGVAQLSNLTGSFQSAMQATSSLNSGQSVNTLRMMGIQVRGSNGAERNPAAIFKDIYNFAVSQSGGRLNASNIAIALQPGNGLYNLLQAASAGDPTLFQALQTAAMQFSQGGNLSKASTTATGQTTAALNSQSALNAKTFGLTAASQGPEAAGFTQANALLGKATDALTKLVSSNSAAAWALTQLAKGETIASSPIGKGGSNILSSIGKVIKGGIEGFIAGERVDPEGGGLVGAVVGAGIGLFGSGAGHGATGGLGQGATVGPNVQGLSGNGVGAALTTAASLQGTPYSWGGGSIGGPTSGTQQGSSTIGFDCSSFVQYVFAKVGVMLPRTTYAQVNCGVAVQPSQAQPGDLLFFGNATAPDHVAIYLGNNRLIQAPHTGGVVSTASVSLNTVSACRRLVSGATGTAINGNITKGGKQSVTSMAGNLSGLLSGMSANTLQVGTQNANMNDLMGYTPSQAMGGGTSSPSGIGQGATNGETSYQSSAMAKTYLSINHKTGTLEASVANGTTINYGGVTITVPVPQGAQMDEQKLASLIKKEFVSIGINAKVANS
jgi:cell wall-associated NlpC family hydrolase